MEPEIFHKDSRVYEKSQGDKLLSFFPVEPISHVFLLTIPEQDICSSLAIHSYHSCQLIERIKVHLKDKNTPTLPPGFLWTGIILSCIQMRKTHYFVLNLLFSMVSPFFYFLVFYWDWKMQVLLATLILLSPQPQSFFSSLYFLLDFFLQLSQSWCFSFCLESASAVVENNIYMLNLRLNSLE